MEGAILENEIESRLACLHREEGRERGKEEGGEKIRASFLPPPSPPSPPSFHHSFPSLSLSLSQFSSCFSFSKETKGGGNSGQSKSPSPFVENVVSRVNLGRVILFSPRSTRDWFAIVVVHAFVFSLLFFSFFFFAIVHALNDERGGTSRRVTSLST